MSQNFQQRLWERWLWWVALGLYLVMMGLVVGANVMMEGEER